MMKPGKISSLKEIQLQVPEILQEYADNQELALIALANPLMALEKIGYTFTPEAREEIEDRIRFGKQGAEKFSQLKQSVFEASGNKFDLQSAADIKTNVKAILEKRSASGKEDKSTAETISSARVESILKLLDQPVYRKSNHETDPLSAFIKDHPVIEKLVELRKMEASQPRLADAKALDQILANREVLPLKKITFRLHKSQ
jgi:hypothetical protein